MTYHRHMYKMVSIVEAVNRMIEDKSPEFEFCPICGCEPRDLVAQMPVRREGWEFVASFDNEEDARAALELLAMPAQGHA